MSASCEFKLTYMGKEEDFNKLEEIASNRGC